MFTREVLGLFPRKRIRAIDGMAVTADIWEEAHDYHRQLNRLHTVLQHGAGIVTGFEVIASEPTDNSVYIMPGLAVDAIGNPIVAPEPRAYDLGVAEGRLYLIVSYNESRPQTGAGRGQEDGPLYVQAQYTVEAVTSLPPTPHIELARIWRRDTTLPISLAADPNQPRGNEIDLRFRRQVGTQQKPVISVGLVGLRGSDGARHGEGIATLAAGMRLAGSANVWLDRNVPLSDELLRYDLIMVVGRDAVQLTSEEMNALYRYWQGGGVIFYESCRRNQAQGNPPADANFTELLSSFGIKLQPLPADHALLARPYRFGQPPAGFETLGSPGVMVAEGMVVSNVDFACLWRGERRSGPARRSEIRDAEEWGANLILWAAAESRARREVAKSSGAAG
jgi:hypothetical protein